MNLKLLKMLNLTIEERSVENLAFMKNILLLVFLKYFEPLLLIIGLIGNFLILVLMPKRCVQASASAKYYYILIALADLLDLIVGWVLRTLFGEILFIYSSGKLYINFYFINSLFCKILKTLWTLMESFSNYCIW